MKRALTFTLAAILALPLFANEPQKSDSQTPQAKPAATPDSPLVQAAKRANRKGSRSKSILITNDTLRASKGHVTTAAKAPAPMVVPEPTPGPEAQLIARQAKEAAEAKAEKARVAEQQRLAERNKRPRSHEEAMEEAEQGLYETLDIDPAAAEAAAAETAPKPPRD